MGGRGGTGGSIGAGEAGRGRNMSIARFLSQQDIDSYMRKLRDQSSKNRKAAENKAFSNAFVTAQKSGALEVTVNGKKYRRANKRSGTWRPV